MEGVGAYVGMYVCRKDVEYLLMVISEGMYVHWLVRERISIQRGYNGFWNWGLFLFKLTILPLYMHAYVCI